MKKIIALLLVLAMVFALAACGDKTDIGKHTDNTVIKNQKDSSEFADGYTGDIYCKECDALIEKGETIPATHEHDYSDKWTSDDNEHWHPGKYTAAAP